MTDQPLVVEDLARAFGNVTAVTGVSFAVAEGEWFTLLGPSGCGKTTLLRLLAGLERPDGGRIRIAGAAVADADSGRFVPAHRRDVGMVFQSYGIWPHMTVFDNAAFPLRVARRTRRDGDLRQRVVGVLEAVELQDHQLRMPAQLSGGQQQRLALARAIVRGPRLLLLDEPLSSLDARLREAMRSELKSLQHRLGVTTVCVTHDQAEALAMSDRVAVMADGQIVQVGAPRDVYDRPAAPFVAGFLGTTSLIEGIVEHADTRRAVIGTVLGRLVVAAPAAPLNGAPVVVAIRPEAASVHRRPPAGARNVVSGIVTQILFLGDRVDCHVRVGEHTVVARQDPRGASQPGDEVWLELEPDALAVMPKPREIQSADIEECM